MRALLSLVFLLAAGCSRDPVGPTVIVGHILPLGDGAAEQAVHAAQLALQAAGKPNVAVHHADSAKGSTAAQATRLLAVTRAAALLVGPGVSDIEDVLALARSREAPIVVLDEVADESFAGPAILLGPSPKERGRALAEHARKPGARALVVADPKDRVCAAVAAAFAEAWREGGGTVTESEADRSGVSAVLLALPTDRFRVWVESAKGVEGTILYGGPDGTRPNGVRLPLIEATAFAGADHLPEAGRAWAKRFAERFGVAPGRSAVLTSDGLEFVLSGVSESGRDVIAKLKRILASRESFDGLTGTVRWTNGRLLRPLYLVREVGGKREVLKVLPAGER